MEQIKEQIKEQSKLNSGFATIGDAIHKAGDKVEQLDTNKITKQANSWFSDISQRAQDFDADMKTFIKERPMTVLLGAVAVGFVASKLISSATATKKAA